MHTVYTLWNVNPFLFIVAYKWIKEIHTIHTHQLTQAHIQQKLTSYNIFHKFCRVFVSVGGFICTCKLCICFLCRIFVYTSFYIHGFLLWTSLVRLLVFFVAIILSHSLSNEFLHFFSRSLSSFWLCICFGYFMVCVNVSQTDFLKWIG